MKASSRPIRRGKRPDCAEIIDLAAEQTIYRAAEAAAERLSEFRNGRIPFTSLMGALIAPFNLPADDPWISPE